MGIYSPLIVFVTAKVMNFEQITTIHLGDFIWKHCLCHRKGNEFWANHNTLVFDLRYLLIVFVTAKVMNFEQITTGEKSFGVDEELSLSPQR